MARGDRKSSSNVPLVLTLSPTWAPHSHATRLCGVACLQVSIELGTRHYFIWRFLQQCVNTLWMDTDVHISRNVYPYLKGANKDVNLLMKDHMVSRLELNTGIMYAQNVQPEGAVARSYLMAFNNWKWGIQQQSAQVRLVQRPGGLSHGRWTRPCLQTNPQCDPVATICI